MTDDEILREWKPVGWMALTFVILLGVVGILLSGCAPLPPPAPAVVKSVTIEHLSKEAGLELVSAPQDLVVFDQQKIARNGAQRAKVISSWLVWMLFGGGFFLAFLWAIRWPWNRRRRHDGAGCDLTRG